MRRLLLALALSAVGCHPAPLPTASRPLFAEARAVAADAAGRLYVADAGRGVVYRVPPTGGAYPAGGNVRFERPVAVDPTNGLVLVVADAAGRLLRLSQGDLLLETIPVPALAAAEAPTDYGRPGAAGAAPPGEPVAVASGAAGELFVLERLQGAVLRWDAARRRSVLLHPATSALRRPVDLVVQGNRLFVADAEGPALLVFDLLGGLVEHVALPPGAPVVALGAAAEGVLVVRPRAVALWSRGGGLRALALPPGAGPLVDAVEAGGRLWLLSATALQAVPWADATRPAERP